MLCIDVQYKKILVPIDGSKNSLRALSHAVALARSLTNEVEIGILYVSVLSQILPITAQVQGDKIPKDSKNPVAFAEKIIAEALKQIPDDVPVLVQVYNEKGAPSIVITDFAQQNGYDMIIIGSRGLGTIAEVIFGSVSKYVIHHAQCPVLVVK